MDPVIEAAGKGIQHTFDYGLAVTILVLGLLAAAYLVRYLLSRCDSRFEQSLAMHADLTKDMKGVVEKNTSAYYDLREEIRNKKV